MEKSNTGSLSSKSSRDSRGRAPVPLPRTKFMEETDELYDEKGRKIHSKTRSGKREYKPKGTYSLIKDLLPNRKSKNRDKNERTSKFHKPKPEVPPRPRPSKQRQTNESKDKEHFPNKYGSVENRVGQLKSSHSERSLQDIFPSPSSQHRQIEHLTVDPPTAVLVPPSSDDQANTNSVSGVPHTARTPGISLLSQVTTQPKITTKEQLVETSQRAMECIQEARGAFYNSQYNKAARKYQKSLDLIDNVLETPLTNLHLSDAEVDTAQQTLLEVRLLRKDALQGFSDSQCEYSLPQTTMDLPTGAPPTYNDVLKEDLLMYNPPTAAGPPPLVPNLASGRETSQNSDLVSISEPTHDVPGSRYNTSRIESQLFFTPRSSIPDSREVGGQSEFHLASNSGPNSIRKPIVASRPDLVVMNGEDSSSCNVPDPPDGKPHLAVRPKIRPIPVNKKKPVFPPDIDVKTQRKKSRNGPVVPKKPERSNQYLSNESLTSETSFKSAVSTPNLTPRTKNIDEATNSGSINQLVHKYPILDPFTFEDPFPKQEPTPKSSSDAFNNLNGETINPSSKRLTHKISFLERTSYHTEIIKNPHTNPFLNSTTDSPLNVNNSANSYSYHQQPTPNLSRGDISQNQLDESRVKTSLSNPTAGASSLGANFNETDGPISKGNHSYETSFSVDDSILNQRKNREVNPTDTFAKRTRLTKSVVDLSNKKKPTRKKSRKRHNLSRMKNLSRSNESILLMFDPIGVQDSSSSDTDIGNDGDDFMVDKNTVQSNPVYGTNDETTTCVQSRDQKSPDGQHEKAIVAKTNGTLETHNPAGPLLVIDDNEDELATLSGQATEAETGRPHSLYPKLSVSEGISARPLPALPQRPQQPDPLPRRTFGDAREITSVNFRRRDGEESISTVQDNHSVQSGRLSQGAKPGNRDKEKRTSKSRSSKDLRHRSRHNIDEVGEGAAVGRSAFYGDTSNSPSSPSVLQDGRERHTTPAAPPRSSSTKNNNPWQEIVHVGEAVKLFFLSDAGVSSPFNRQSLLLLRKYGGRDGGDKARIEIGGELFSRDLHDKNTMVMLDHHGDYIMQSSPGVFLCMVLCSKVKKRDAQALEKTFEIYANFGKESQMMRLPGGMESAAANVKKAVKDKAPGVMKTTSFVKRNSLRALRKLKGAIVGDEEEEGLKQELGIEFLPLKKACEKFREARQVKNVRYF